MCYDLAVFDPAAAPHDKAEFLVWYYQKADWSESHDYNDPAVSTATLRAWFLEMITEFPMMNGPYAADPLDPDDSRVTDYSVGQAMIYVAFRWSQAEVAYETMFRLAAKHGVGLFDVSSADGKVWRPDGNGQLSCIYAATAESA